MPPSPGQIEFSRPQAEETPEQKTRREAAQDAQEFSRVLAEQAPGMEVAAPPEKPSAPVPNAAEFLNQKHQPEAVTEGGLSPADQELLDKNPRAWLEAVVGGGRKDLSPHQQIEGLNLAQKKINDMEKGQTKAA